MDSDHHLTTDRLLWGRTLRFILVDHLRRHETLSVADMVVMLQEHGYELRGRPSKVISDALRWEIARGRVVRLGRGIYGYGHAPPTTARRIRLFARTCHAWIVAVTRGEEPPPTPPDRRQKPWQPPEDPTRPPWENLNWLWTT